MLAAANSRCLTSIERISMGVGFSFLKQLQAQHGREGGFAAYNGSGPAAVAYGQRAMERAAIWHGRLVKAAPQLKGTTS
jgi:hypothetical protein